jgi:hypothetical protein
MCDSMRVSPSGFVSLSAIKLIAVLCTGALARAATHTACAVCLLLQTTASFCASSKNVPTNAARNSRDLDCSQRVLLLLYITT